MSAIMILVYLFYAYLIVGLFFALWFVCFGIPKVDSGMEGAKWNLRLLLIPGSMLFWGLLLAKYLKK